MYGMSLVRKDSKGFADVMYISFEIKSLYYFTNYNNQTCT